MQIYLIIKSDLKNKAKPINISRKYNFRKKAKALPMCLYNNNILKNLMMIAEIKTAIFPLHIKIGQYFQTKKWKITEIFLRINPVNPSANMNDFTNILMKHSIITAV